MNIDLNKAMKDCEGIEKVQERTNAGVVSQILIIIYKLDFQRQKFDSATYEKNKQEQGKKQYRIINFIKIFMTILNITF